MTIPESKSLVLYVIGADLTANKTVLLRLSKDRRTWNKVETTYFEKMRINLGFIAITTYPEDTDSVLILGGLSPDGEVKSS
jgi:hypothetical protein